ncbi:MAG TPA: hypothetical protein VKA27_08975 [Sunxiuqinia sp.]|nr:hypothetical protein [Sunxiuqinia sp.]
MKNGLLLLVLAIVFGSCSTTIRMVNEAFNHALVGQDELTIYAR